MEAVVAVDVLKGYMSSSRTVGTLVDYTLLVAGQGVGSAVATDKGDTALADQITEMFLQTAKGRDIVRLVEVHAALVVENSQF